MRSIVAAALLAAAASVSAEMKVFVDPARPVKGAVRASILLIAEARHPEAAAVLLVDMHVTYKGVLLSFPTAHVLMKASETSPGVCRGPMNTYQFDTVRLKWETVEDPDHITSYFFPPAEKTKCSSVDKIPTLLLGRIADADIVNIIDGLRTARIAKDHADQGLAKMLPHDDETIEGIGPGPTIRDLYTSTKKVTFEKRDGVWWIVDVGPAPK